MIVEDDYSASEVMLLRHLLEEKVHCILVCGRCYSGEKTAVTDCPNNRNVVLVLLAQLYPNASLRLPDASWPLPQIGGRFVHVPDGLAHSDPLHEVLQESHSALSELFLKKKDFTINVCEFLVPIGHNWRC